MKAFLDDNDMTHAKLEGFHYVDQSGKTNHFESCCLLPRLQQISELKQTTMLE